MFRNLFPRRLSFLLPPTTRLSARRNMATTTTSFTQAVVRCMRNLYPESLADTSFDNTGLLLEAPAPAKRRANSVLLTIDLTRAVADEALKENVSVVVAYHPIIFRGLKALTLADPQQATLLRLASEGVSVYCPHTAVDAVPGGMADWLCDIVTGSTEEGSGESEGSESVTDVTTSEDTSAASTKPASPAVDASDPFITPVKTRKPSTSTTTQRTYSKPSNPTVPAFPSSTISRTLQHTRRVITPSPPTSLATANAPHAPSTPYSATNTGAGRLITLQTPLPLPQLISRIATGVGSPKGFPVAIPQSTNVASHTIHTIAVCPGSGSSVLRSTSADLVFTGELSHHEALAVTERGGCVITLFHSNSERGYLLSVMRERLELELGAEWTKSKGESDDGVVEVKVSEVDRDPFGILVLEGDGAD